MQEAILMQMTWLKKNRVIGELNAGYKNGGKVRGCGKAKKGKGRAYGKNS